DYREPYDLEMNSPGRDGELKFDRTGESIGPATTPALFSAMKLAESGKIEMAVTRSICKLGDQSVWGREVIVTLEFGGAQLSAVELCVRLPGDTAGWDGWTHQQEVTRKKTGEEWAAVVFGAPLTLKSFQIDGRSITPTETPESARHAVFAWGEVGSYYDGK